MVTFRMIFGGPTYSSIEGDNVFKRNYPVLVQLINALYVPNGDDPVGKHLNGRELDLL